MKFKINNKNQKKTVYRGDRTRGQGSTYTKSGKKGKKWIVIVIAAVLVLGAAGGAAAVAFEIGGSNAKAQGEIEITVPDGASTGEVATLLKEKGLIGSPTVFKLYSKLTGADGTFQHGLHKITGGNSYDQIIEELQKTTYLVVETVRLTFPEGTTSLKMAIMLKEQGLIETLEEFIAACNNDTFEVSFFDQISNNALKFIKLEGFLYPDTYDFEVGSSVHDIILLMLRNFEEKVMTDQLRADLAGSKYSLEEIIVLASIIQKESFNGEEKNVSSVFNNRLNNNVTGYRLESDTSRNVNYGGFIPGVLWYYYGGKENVPAGMCEAYDTYVVSGLIVGAICNPEVVMIDAALHPNDTPYYFFFTDKYGKFYYSKTIYEHEYQWAHTEH